MLLKSSVNGCAILCDLKIRHSFFGYSQDFVQPCAHQGFAPLMVPEQIPFLFDHRIFQLIRKS
ncbi:hypothetical protein D3C73_1586300 [compost metagenome]